MATMLIERNGTETEVWLAREHGEVVAVDEDGAVVELTAADEQHASVLLADDERWDYGEEFYRD